MHVKVLTLRYAPELGALGDTPLRAFLSDKRALSIRDHFFVVQDVPHLACLVTYRSLVDQDAAETSRRTPASSKRRGDRVTRERLVASLDEQARARFETLRIWRSDRANIDGVPPYVVFTNKQLAALAKSPPVTAAALRAVEGVGKAKIERYATEVIALLARPEDESSPVA